MNKIKLTEINRLDNLNQNELLKITGGALEPGDECCCGCNDKCECTTEGCTTASTSTKTFETTRDTPPSAAILS